MSALSKTHCRNARAVLMAVLFACILTGMISGPVGAQNPEDELGNWYIYNGTIRFSPEWSVFTEFQARMFDMGTNVDELFVRAAGHYNFTPDALVGMGYMRADSWPYDDGSRYSIEDRLYQQLTLWQNWSRTRIEHRYRLEQRWFRRDSGNSYSNRMRYRVQATIPISNTTMEPRTWFANFYNEFFISLDDTREFDQNRLYGAGGYQFTQLANLQLGFLWKARASADFYRLQVFYTHNFDLQ